MRLIFASVYSTCLFCHASLGANETIERFPIGRRLAFDAAKGRLWVVCGRCRRWNLTPLEERWEAIEACERAFRSTPMRTSTSEIGLTTLPEGLVLIRIGRPLRPEFAAWRYGRTFARRHWRGQVVDHVAPVARYLETLAGGVMASGLWGSGRPLSAFLGLTGAVAFMAGRRLWWNRHVVAALRTGEEVVEVRQGDLRAAALSTSAEEGALALRVQHSRGVATLSGSQAVRGAGAILARLNWAGVPGHRVLAATRLLGAAGASEAFVTKIATEVRDRGTHAETDRPRRFALPEAFDVEDWEWREAPPHVAPETLAALPPTKRVALEMALHEDSERRAMEGAMAELEAAWREAEEIAAIADNLFLPHSVEAWLRAHGRPS